MHKRLFRPKSQRLTNHQKYGTIALRKQYQVLVTPFAHIRYMNGNDAFIPATELQGSEKVIP